VVFSKFLIVIPTEVFEIVFLFRYVTPTTF
jgi:hypothetical protein